MAILNTTDCQTIPKEFRESVTLSNRRSQAFNHYYHSKKEIYIDPTLELTLSVRVTETRDRRGYDSDM